MIDILRKSKIITEKENFNNTHSDKILADLLGDIRRDCCDDSSSASGNGDTNSYIQVCSKSASVLDNLMKKEDFINGKDQHFSTEFKFIGYKHLILKNSEGIEEALTLELFCRHYFNEEKEISTEDFELLFNDVSRTKKNEEKKSEIKYKTMFLSKVAHEFKNPLICIVELVNQLSDILATLDEKRPSNSREVTSLQEESKENLHQINSLSNYLIMLIRDFNYFSQKEMKNTKLELNFDECEIDEIVLFCREICRCLIKKSSKKNEVVLRFEKSIDTPAHIITDEIRLKQVLINLLSNAIKFTPRGEILLQVKREVIDDSPVITFIVEDSGEGINEETQKYLFDPFKNISKSDNYLNPLGSGLGMSIIKDLTISLGKKIEFDSNSKGSKFWFSIPVVNDKKASELYPRNPMQSSKQRLISFKKETIFQSNKNIFLKTLYSHLKYNSSDDKVTKNNATNTPNNFELSSAGEEFSEKSENLNDSLNCVSEATVEIDNLPFMQNEEGLQEVRAFTTNKNEYKIHINDLAKKVNEVVINPAKTKVTSAEEESYADNLKNTSNLNKTASHSNSSSNILSIIDKHFQKFKSEISEGVYTVVIVDDEKFTRLSTRRILISIAENLKKKINILEAEDGIECLYLVYNCVKKGVKISFIISDQTMTYLSGSNAAIALKQLSNSNLLKGIPYFINTAYEDEATISQLKNSPINEIFSKPLNKRAAEQLISDLL